MIRETRGDLLRDGAAALVNPVNTRGIMGAGLALQFQRAFPENFLSYAAACRAKRVFLGKMFVHATGSYECPDYIINFPTKDRPHDLSRIEDILDGLIDLRDVIRHLSIPSIAIPALGCGLGRLKWDEVQSLISKILGELEDVDIALYPPGYKAG